MQGILGSLYLILTIFSVLCGPHDEHYSVLDIAAVNKRANRAKNLGRRVHTYWNHPRQQECELFHYFDEHFEKAVGVMHLSE